MGPLILIANRNKGQRSEGETSFVFHFILLLHTLLSSVSLLFLLTQMLPSLFLSLPEEEEDHKEDSLCPFHYMN